MLLEISRDIHEAETLMLTKEIERLAISAGVVVKLRESVISVSNTRCITGIELVRFDV